MVWGVFDENEFLSLSFSFQWCKADVEPEFNLVLFTSFSLFRYVYVCVFHLHQRVCWKMFICCIDWNLVSSYSKYDGSRIMSDILTSNDFWNDVVKQFSFLLQFCNRSYYFNKFQFVLSAICYLLYCCIVCYVHINILLGIEKKRIKNNIIYFNMQFKKTNCNLTLQ